MPRWTVPLREYEIPRQVAFLDTNVLVSFANPNDEWHEHTNAVLDLNEYRWAISHATLIEAWNFLAGRVRRVDLAHDLMTWALTPGQVLLVGDAIEPVETADKYSKMYHVDVVDASLLDLTTRISEVCNLDPPALVATYDLRDFMRLTRTAGLRFGVYDMRELAPY